MKTKIDKLNNIIKIKLGKYYNGAYIPYDCSLFHLQALFELHKL